MPRHVSADHCAPCLRRGTDKSNLYRTTQKCHARCVPQLDDIVGRTPMATRSFTADDETAAGIGPIDRLTASAGRVLRYQLNDVAATTEDVVESAGGWLCDRAKAGWDVNVLVAEGVDPRPLTILGATAS